MTTSGPSEVYWEKRYAEGGDSGSGSYGTTGAAKAAFLNDFISRNKISSVVDLGCGDGNLASQLRVAQYTGTDVSRSAIDIAARRLPSDGSRALIHTRRFEGAPADLSLSLDVISHLVDASEYKKYLANLFAASRCFVVIYSRNQDSATRHAHVRHRRFTDWVGKNRPDFILVDIVKVPDAPPGGNDVTPPSAPGFYVFQKIDAKVYPSSNSLAAAHVDTPEEIARHKEKGTDRFDLVTVIYDDELPLLRIQAISLARFVADDLVGKIIYCVNEKKPDTCVSFIRSEVMPLLGVHSGKVELLLVTEVGTITTQEGWLTQQACKLEAARLCASDYYLVLDAKHHFIRRLARSDLFSDGRAKKPFVKVRADQRPWLEDSLRYFGVVPSLANKRSPASAPPFTMHAETTRRMVTEIKEREKKDLVAFFGDKTDRTTEFTLYYAYLLANGLKDAHLVDTENPSGSIRIKMDPERKIRLERELVEGRLWCFSVHRRRLAKLGTVDRHIIVRTWLACGLFETEGEAVKEITRLQSHFGALRETEEEKHRMASLRKQKALEAAKQ